VFWVNPKNQIKLKQYKTEQCNRRYHTLPPVLPPLGICHNSVAFAWPITELWTQLTCTKNFVKPQTCDQKNRQRQRHAHRNTSHPYWVQSNKPTNCNSVTLSPDENSVFHSN